MESPNTKHLGRSKTMNQEHTPCLADASDDANGSSETRPSQGTELLQCLLELLAELRKLTTLQAVAIDQNQQLIEELAKMSDPDDEDMEPPRYLDGRPRN
jgi:hypothetical protein